jgi:hypothetical protein
MATDSSVTRALDASGDEIKSYTDAAGNEVQGMALDAEVNGEMLSWASTAGVAAETAVAKASAGRFFSCDVVLTTPFPTDRWLMIFDKGSAPINADVPVFRARVGGGWASIDLGVYGRVLASGVAVAISTTVDTLTLPGGGEAFFQVGYL